MIIKEVEFTEEDKAKLVNELCFLAESNDKCHTEKNGSEVFFKFTDMIHVFAKILIFDDFNTGSKPIRHVSTDVTVFQVESMDFVKSNLDYLFEDRINKSLINEFHKIY